MKQPEVMLTPNEKAMRAALPRAVKPRRAATIVLMRGPENNPKILMGQRGKGHDFMPSVYVFPGGRVDRADNYAPFTGALSPRTENILESAYPPRRARALVMAAIRETYEETSLILGVRGTTSGNIRDASWQAFLDTGFIPDISGIEVFGRAITPPHRHRRYDTWFFIKRLEGDIADTADSAELLQVGWFSFDDMANLKMQRATTMMLKVLRQYLSHDRPPGNIFWSHMVRGQYLQEKFPRAD